MQLLYAISSVLFFLWILRNTIFWTSVWEDCHFRFNAFFQFLISRKGRRILFSPLSLLKLFAFLGFILSVFAEWFLPYCQIFIAVIYLFQGISLYREIKRGGYRRYLSRLASFLVVIAVLFTSVILYSIPLVDQFAWLVVIDKLVPSLTVLGAYIVAFPLELFADAQYEKATNKIQQFRSLKTILFYGDEKEKSIDYGAHILERAHTIVVIHNAQADTDIALALLKRVKPETDLLLISLTANVTDLEKIYALTNPRIMVLSSIESHEKGRELLRFLPKDTILLLAKKNEELLKLSKQVRRMNLFYAVVDQLTLQQQSDLIGSGINRKKRSCTFIVSLGGRSLSFSGPLFLADTLSSLIPALFLATYYKMKTPQIRKAVTHLKGV